MLGPFFPPRTRRRLTGRRLTGRRLTGRRLPAKGRVRAAARAAAARAAAVCAAAVCAAAASAIALGGCAARTAAGPPIQIATAYVGLPNASGTTDAYVAIRNNGSADRLISARSSAGGRVSLSGPVGHGSGAMGIVRNISIPADALVRLNPDGFHLVITRSGPMRAGTEITLTLVFAKAGPVSVAVPVENPATGGGSYLGD
jgi:copper(I)-binding protein